MNNITGSKQLDEKTLHEYVVKEFWMKEHTNVRMDPELLDRVNPLLLQFKDAIFKDPEDQGRTD